MAVFVGLVGALAIAVLADWTTGVFLAPRSRAIAFAPNSKFRHETSEFVYSVETNSVGLRDREVSRKKDGEYRVLAVGDSFTYGWGVELEQSWPKVLEEEMNQSGLKSVVLNLGVPKNSTEQYQGVACRAAEDLEPDLILVGVLQGDDLHQLVGKVDTPTLSQSPRLLRSLFTNLSKLFEVHQEFPPPSKRIGLQWKAIAQDVLERFSPDQRVRYENLDPVVKEMFLTGDLNPYLVYGGVLMSHGFAVVLDTAAADFRPAVERMAGHVAAIERCARDNQAKSVVISIPEGGYVNDVAHGRYKRLGFVMDPVLLETTAMDDATRLAAELAGVEYLEITAGFRERSDDGSLFFEFDGHPTVAGQRLLGEEVAEALRRSGTIPGFGLVP